MDYIDLHVHSLISDGTLTPTELVHYAKAKNLRAFALTDHDSIDGLPEAHVAGQQLGIEIINGIEFSTDYGKKDIHIVGLDFRMDDPAFLEYIQEFIELRDERNRKMVNNLQKAGMAFTYEDLTSAFLGSVITRAHFAKMMHMKGYVATMKEAFERYIGDHAPYYVPREKVSPQKAVSIIREAGGIPILAHPILYHLPETELDALTGSLVSAGLLGIEAIYSTYGPYEEQSMKKLAAKYHLQVSGGSDYHGSNKPGIDLGTGTGNLRIPYSVLLSLRASR